MRKAAPGERARRRADVIRAKEFVSMPPHVMRGLLFGSACVIAAVSGALAQTQLPPIVVEVKKKPPEKPTPRRVVTPAPTSAPVNPAVELANRSTQLDVGRANLLPTAGSSTFVMPREALEALPQGTNAPLDKVLLQTPGVSQDSAASGDIHVRNEHADVQYRVNGIMLPDGVSGFGHVLDTNFIGRLALITGALPAQHR